MTTPKLFSQKESLIASVSEMTQQSSGVFWLVDANTRTHCLPLLSNTNNHHIIEVEPGETAKAYSSAAEVWNQLLANHADRKSLLICLGGGVVTDLGGWVASTYKRGIPFLHIPTTLLSMT
ncbi:MAG: hypothetical protein JNM00_00800, partial [Flavobacteriales bacterium]|nr:hypothetical protein [Flavobacteriales bacterium]